MSGWMVHNSTTTTNEPKFRCVLFPLFPPFPSLCNPLRVETFTRGFVVVEFYIEFLFSFNGMQIVSAFDEIIFVSIESGFGKGNQYSDFSVYLNLNCDGLFAKTEFYKFKHDKILITTSQ